MKKAITIISAFLVIGLLVVVGLLAVIFGSSSQKQRTSVPVDTFLPVLEQQIEAFNNKDIDSYMKTIYEDSPIFENTKAVLGDRFKNYDYDQTVELVSWEVVGATNDELIVKVVHIIRNAKESGVKDTKVTMTHTLKKSGDVWKVYSSVIDKTEYLN